MLLFLLSVIVNLGVSFRVYDGSEQYAGVRPYEVGFVGEVEAATFLAEVVNEGSASSATQPNQWAGVNARQVCPGMVGPVGSGGLYYCRAKEYGYCDRRSGRCVCEIGYTGIDCGQCTNTHYRAGELCYPKRLCPGGTLQCSGAGTCNYTTGQCQCQDHRIGDDCSKPRCTLFDKYCLACTNHTCVKCIDGYSFLRGACHSCAHEYDPRCTQCDESKCLECADLLLSSIRRSGPRDTDPPLPDDELKRELSTSFPYGTQRADFFDEAEPYFILSQQNTTIPLHQAARRCDQYVQSSHTLVDDDQHLWNCSSLPQLSNLSHVVCGNYGTLSWSSPEYTVNEADNTIRLTVKRTGGGLGQISFRYAIHQNKNRLSSVLANTRFIMRPGVVELSFLLTIHDDRLFDKSDSIHTVELLQPTGGATIGPQRKATIHIIDDDQSRTGARYSRFAIDSTALAGAESIMLVSAYTCSGRPQRLGGDIFLVELLSDQFVYPFLLSDMGNGSYSSNWSVTTAGQYKAFAYLAVPNGLRAEYFDNVWGLGQAKTIRIESQINLDAQLGPLTTSTGPDFAFIRWTGRLVSDTSEKYNITINSVGDGLGARLWFDGQLAIDAWDVKRRPLGERTAPPIALIAKRLYSLVLEVRISRYAGKGNRRDPAPQLAGGRAKRIALEWASASRPRTVINSSSFYYLDELNSDSPQNVTIVSAATSADYSYARGTGLISGKAGQPFEFEVLLTDIYGNRRDDVDANMPTPTFAHYIDPRARSAIALTRDAEHALSANASLFEIAPGGASIGSERLDVIFTDFDRKTAIVSGVWYPTIAGLYRLDILFRQNSSTYDEILFSVQKPIQDSPFYVTVVPASKALAANSYVHTRPHRSIAGEFATFQVVAVDALGNERRESGDDFTILARFADVGLETTDWSRVGSGSLVEWQTASHLAGDAMQLVAVGYVDDVGNGTYFLNVRPTIAGKHNVYITLRGLDIRDSPFTLNIEHADAHAAMSTAEGLGLTHATVNESAFVIATIRDAYGNPFIANATNILTCTIISEVSTNGTCETSLGNGSYVCSYVPIKSGWSLLSIQYGDQHFANSPFSVMVADAMPYGPTSNGSGVGLRSAEAGVQATFDVTIRDVGGNIVNDVGLDRSANLTVTLNHTQINDANVIGSVLPLGAGLYRLTYTAIVSGFYDVYVREDDLDISGSPFSLFVEPTRVSAYHSIVAIDKVLYTCREHPVKATAIDRFGNQLLNSTERVYAVIHGGGAINGSAGIFTETLRVDGIPLYDGHYDVSFWPRVAGKHSIELFFLEAGIDLEVYGEYDFTNFMGHRVDESIDFAWAGSGPFFGHTEWLDISLYDGLWRNVSDFNSTAMRTEMYSMRWKGKLQFESIRTYGLRAVIDEDAHASLFISSVDGFLGDGRETPALNVVVLGKVQGNRTILQSNTVLVGSFEPTGNGLHDFEFLYQHGRGIEASVRLEWRTSDDSDWITVPASAYIRPMRLANTTYYVDVTAGPTVASESTLVLTNNGNYDAGIWTDLGIVEIRDTCSNLRNTDASDAVAVVGYPRQYNNAKPIVAEITDLGNSTYQATALAKIAGDYTFVAVVGTAAVSAAIKSAAIEMSLVTAEEIFALNAAHVRGSPWTVHFAPGAIVASTSSLSGAALFRGVTAGSMARVLVTGRDATYNIVNKNVNASKFFVYLRLQLRTNEIKPSPSERLIQSVPILLEDGRVAFDFSLTIAGLYELSATYDGLALAGSPYPVDCLPSIANASTTAPIGALATMARANVAAEPSRRFFIRVRDEFHNDQLVGGQYFRVIVRGVITTIGFADDKDDGRYAITFSTANLTAGNFLVHVMLCDQANRGLLGHVFHNTGLQGKAAHIQIDDTFSLSYAAQPYTSISWTGYLLAPDTAVFNFRLVLAQSADDAMLFIEDALVTATDTGKHSADGQVALSRNALYEISLEYRCTTASGGLVLQWSTDAVPPQPIPTYFLFPTASHIAGSPFPLRLIDDGGNASIFFESVWWGN